MDSRAPIARCINHALVAQGLAAQPEEALHRWIGSPLHGVFRALLAMQGAGEERVVGCIEAYRGRYADLSLELALGFPGMHELVAALARRLPLAVATSKPREFAEPILRTLGLAGAFRAIVGPSLDPAAEPKTRTVERALAALGFAASPGGPPIAAMVGDTAFDVIAARAHGLVSVGVTWGIGSERELREAGVTHLVASPAELASLLGRLAGSPA